MVGHGKQPLDQPHFDQNTLEEFVLGHLLPDHENAIRRHLEICAQCRAQAAEIRAICQRLTAELERELDQAPPPTSLNFDKIAAEWRKPPRRVHFGYRLQSLIPDPPMAALLALFAVAFLLLLPGGETAALRGLNLPANYDGPPAIVAASTETGLVLVRFERDAAAVVLHLHALRYPHNLQFSPDGTWLAAYDDGRLHILEARQGGAHIERAVAEAADWAWSPDGRALAYTDGAGELDVLEVAAHTGRVLVPGREGAWGRPAWSDDGRAIAYSAAPPSTDPERSQQPGIWRVDVSTGFRVELARPAEPDAGLIAPAAWVGDGAAVVAWDIGAAMRGESARLFQIDGEAHAAEVLPVQAAAEGARLTWPVSSSGRALAVQGERLATLDTVAAAFTLLPEHIPQPDEAAWAPQAGWLAYTVRGAAPGRGLYLFAPDDGTLREVLLPADAVETWVTWADAEHLFVLRQRLDSATSDLWLVPLTSDAPSCILSNVRLPDASPTNGWRWQDVLALQTLSGNPAR